jgi:hypothetical protein
LTRNVGRDDDAALRQLLLGGRRGRRVGALDDEAGADLVGVGAMDHAAERRGDQEVAGDGEDLLVGDRLALREARDGAVLRHVREQRRHVEAVGVVQAAVDVRDRHHLATQLVEEAGGEGADVAEALDGGYHQGQGAPGTELRLTNRTGTVQNRDDY